MGGTHKQHQPHVGHCGFRMDKRLQAKREDDCRHPACSDLRSLNVRSRSRTKPRATGEERQRSERPGDSRGKTRGEIVLTEEMIACYLRPIGEGRFVEAELVVEVRNDIIASLNHLPRGFSKAGLVAID